MDLFLNHHVPLTPSNRGSKSLPFKNAAKYLEISENVNRLLLWKHFLALNVQSYSFRQSRKWVKVDRAQYVWSSSGPITIVVMTLTCFCRFFVGGLWCLSHWSVTLPFSGVFLCWQQIVASPTLAGHSCLYLQLVMFSVYLTPNTRNTIWPSVPATSKSTAEKWVLSPHRMCVCMCVDWSVAKRCNLHK